MPKGTRLRGAYSPVNVLELDHRLGVEKDEEYKADYGNGDVNDKMSINAMSGIEMGGIDLKMDDNSPSSPLSPLPPEDDLPSLSPHSGSRHLDADGSHLDSNHEHEQDEIDPESALTTQQLNIDGTPRRPMNAFMIFARKRRPQVSAQNSTMKTGQISKILSLEWGGMPLNEKQYYLDQAKKLKDNFNMKYPDYVYRRRPNNSRRKRKTEGSGGGGGGGTSSASASNASAVSRVSTAPYPLSENNEREFDNDTVGSDSGMDSTSPSLGRNTHQSLSPIEGNHNSHHSHPGLHGHHPHSHVHHHNAGPTHGVGGYSESAHSMSIHGHPPSLTLSGLAAATHLAAGSGLSAYHSVPFTSSPSSMSSLIPPQPTFGRNYSGSAHSYEHGAYNSHAFSPVSPISPSSAISSSGGNGSSMYNPSPVSANPARGYSFGAGGAGGGGGGGGSSVYSDWPNSATAAQNQSPQQSSSSPDDSHWLGMPLSTNTGGVHVPRGSATTATTTNAAATGLSGLGHGPGGLSHSAMVDAKDRNRERMRMSSGSGGGGAGGGGGHIPQFPTLTDQYRPESTTSGYAHHRVSGIGSDNGPYEQQGQVMGHGGRGGGGYPLSPNSPRQSISSSVDSGSSNGGGGGNSLYPPSAHHHTHEYGQQHRPPMLHPISTFENGAGGGGGGVTGLGRNLSPLSAVSAHSAVSYSSFLERESR